MTLRSLLALGATFLAGAAGAEGTTGDPAAGEALFGRLCGSCHVVADAEGTVLAGRAARTGPNLYGVAGATPGTREGFAYSDALLAYGATGAVWTEESFAAFVADPNGHLRTALDDPSARSKMAFRLRDAGQAADIYAFLAQFSPGAEAAPGPAADAAGDAQAPAPDLAAGETLYAENCRNCHGPRARGMASFPRLTGLGEALLLDRLRQYHAGEQVGPNSAIMFDVAADLSEADMVNVAAYIAAAFD
jgi:cytochrome c